MAQQVILWEPIAPFWIPRYPFEYDSEDWLCWVLSWVEDNPGVWTARLCRAINGLPETEASIIHCGLCDGYSNPRKRRRAARLAATPTLPGLDPPLQLHPPCPTISLRRLQYLLRKLRDDCLMIYSEEGATIPDPRNHRGWDLATKWFST